MGFPIHSRCCDDDLKLVHTDSGEMGSIQPSADSVSPISIFDSVLFNDVQIKCMCKLRSDTLQNTATCSFCAWRFTIE